MKPIKLVPKSSSYKEFCDNTARALGKEPDKNPKPNFLLLELLNLIK